jgi:hypothetical protein
MTDKAPAELDADQPWNQLAGTENDMWYSRFLIYRDMGPVRKIMGAAKIEAKRLNKPAPKWPPSKWREKAKEYAWHERAKAWDEYRRQEVFTEGYAYELTRIKKLNVMAQALENRIIKGFLNAKEPKGVSYELIDLYLKTVEALAKETGGRIQKKEVSGLNGTPLEVLLFLPEQEQGDGLEDAAGDQEEWE